MPYLSSLEALAKALAAEMPLHAFVLFGSVVEEVISIIPAPIVMTTAGATALFQGYSLPGLMVLALFASVGKTAGSYVWYILADKGEDVVLPRFGRYLGITHEDVERLGARFSGSWKDTALLTLVRSIPVMPSIAVSIACGVVKLPLRTFFISTFFGDAVRGFFFLYVGYQGLAGYRLIAAHVSSVERYAELGFAALILVALALLYWQARNGGPARLLRRILGRATRG